MDEKRVKTGVFKSALFAILLLASFIALFFSAFKILPSVSGDIYVNTLIILGISTVALLIAAYYLFSSNKTQQHFDELDERNDQYFLQEKMASLGQMIAGVAHEINTPLSYVSNNVELINSCMHGVRDDVIYPVEELRQTEKKSILHVLTSQRKMITAIRDNEYPRKVDRAINLGIDAELGLKSISELVETLKDFSRVDRKERDYADIHELIEITLKVSDRHIERHHVEVIKDYDSATPLLYCTPSKLNQVFLNIVINSCQAIIGGGVLKIRTKFDKSNRNIIIEFIDDGVGMSRKTQKALFDPFYTTKEVGSGTGLGMSIVSSIMQEHNGKIHVDSKLGEGTRISIVLPHVSVESLRGKE